MEDRFKKPSGYVAMKETGLATGAHRFPGSTSPTVNHKQRWREAQNYERPCREHRNEQTQSAETANPGWNAWRAVRLMDWLKQLDAPALKRTAAVPDIGNGPVGITSNLPTSIE